MKIKWLGHAAFLIDDLLIDPFIKDNPACPVKVNDVKCKIVCVTHDHSDHLGDAFEIAKRNNATFVAVHELAMKAKEMGINAEGMNIGGPFKVGDWEISMVNAVHSSDAGHPVGFILRKGKTVYHAGDTGLFMDMMLIGDYEIDVALIPIGGRYTMDVEQAIKACDIIKPKVAIPMHYNTFPKVQADSEQFKLKAPCEVVILKPGEVYEV